MPRPAAAIMGRLAEKLAHLFTASCRVGLLADGGFATVLTAEKRTRLHMGARTIVAKSTNVSRLGHKTDNTLWYAHAVKNRVFDFLSRSSKRTTIALCLVLSLLIAWLDYLSGFEVSLLTFFWLPIYIATWFCGITYGFCFAAFGVGLATLTDWLTGQSFSHPVFLLWIIVSRSISCAVFVWVLARLRSAAEFEAVAAIRGDILSFLSHEVNNAITILKMTRDMMQNSDLQPSSKRKEGYDVLGRVLLNMELTTSNFLNNARQEGGRLTVNLEPVDIRRLVEELTKMFSPVLTQRSQTIIVNIPPNTPKVWVDTSALSLILNNLIGNAVKYTQEGGVITVKAEIPENSRSSLRISVGDTGIGINPEDKQKIMQAFMRLPEAKSMARGVGLGLKTARDLLQLHGSELQIEGERGKGAVFSFTLSVFDR